MTKIRRTCGKKRRNRPANEEHATIARRFPHFEKHRRCSPEATGRLARCMVRRGSRRCHALRNGLLANLLSGNQYSLEDPLLHQMILRPETSTDALKPRVLAGTFAGSAMHLAGPSLPRLRH